MPPFGCLCAGFAEGQRPGTRKRDGFGFLVDFGIARFGGAFEAVIGADRQRDRPDIDDTDDGQGQPRLGRQKRRRDAKSKQV